MPTLDTIHQDTVEVQVEFYDETERQKLLTLPIQQSIMALVENPVIISTANLLTYYLFFRKRPGKEGYRDYTELGKKIDMAWSHMEDFITFNGQSVSIPLDVVQQDPHITERMGESIGLSVISQLHSMTSADWDRLELIGGKDAPPVLDYGIDVDRSTAAQVETKGSSVENNDVKTSALTNHKTSILKKKAKIKELESEGKYPYPTTYRYGTIAALDSRPDSIAKCYLLDPDPIPVNREALTTKLLNRIRFYRDWVSFVSPRSQFSSALNTRVSALERLNNPFELLNVPLRKGNDQEFEFVPYDQIGHTVFFESKAWILDGAAGGVVVPKGKDLFFLGFREILLPLLAEQDFDKLLDYRSETGSLRKTVLCHLSRNRFRSLNLPLTLIQAPSTTTSKEASEVAERQPGEFVQIALKGQIHYSSEGLLFGVLPIPRT